jgi:hypothetical protein
LVRLALDMLCISWWFCFILFFLFFLQVERGLGDWRVGLVENYFWIAVDLRMLLGC